MLHLLILLFLLIGILFLYNNHILHFKKKQHQKVEKKTIESLSTKELDEMSGLVNQLNGRVKNIESQMNSIKFTSNSALSLAKQNKEVIEESAESIKETDGEMEAADRELQEVSSGL